MSSAVSPALVGVPAPQSASGSAADQDRGFRTLPVDQREALARLAAEIMRDSGAVFATGDIIVLASWLGGMD
jgi:hypothetical protein